MFDLHDTIAAVATPPGRGGLGVVRISGPRAGELAALLLCLDRPLEPRRATFARLVDPETGTLVDHVVATWFAAPHSYTGDDVVELSAHGSPVLLAAIVRLLVAHGARPAGPGEFTLRAYLRGRMSLPQAEAVADLVNAVTPIQARAAIDQLDGTLTGAIGRVDEALFDLCARLEASLDFPDEGFHFITREEAAAAVVGVRDALDRLARDGRAGRVVREGRTVAIVGRPNAGKSSLFNALAGAPRAIVTDMPGTTRDLITEQVAIEGLAITLVDTAGLGDPRDPIEAEGMRRAELAGETAALVLLVIDGSEPLHPDDRARASRQAGLGLLVRSKVDRPAAWRPADLGADAPAVIDVSATDGTGLKDLRRAIAAALTGRDDLRDPPAITNVRHLALIDRAREAMARAAAAIDAGATEELVLTDLTMAREHLEAITGRRAPDDLLEHIFRTFCVGK